MIISEKVLLKRMGNKNLKYYSDLGYDVSSEEFEVDVKHLSKGSKVLIIAKCDFCNKEVSRKYELYLKNISSNGLFSCSPKCGKNKTIMTNKDKYGVEYVNQSNDIREKTKNTNLKKYGVESPMMSEYIKDKVKKTNLEKYGVECTLQSEEVKNKSKETLMDKYGVDHNFKSKDLRDKMKETLIDKWGVDNPSKSEEVKNKKKETSLKNWGVEYPTQSEEIMNRVRETNIKNLGVEYPMMNSKVVEKSKKTLMENFGVEHNMKSEEIVDKMKLNNLEKWGVEWTLQSNDIRDKMKLSNLEKWGTSSPIQSEKFRSNNFRIANDISYLKYDGDEISTFWCENGKHEFKISSSNYHSRLKSMSNRCTICYPIESSTSIKEKEIFNFIVDNYSGNIIPNYKDHFEIDIFLPDLNLGFEFNGLYWHSIKKKDRKYHINKTKFFIEKGIKIIHIWEDDWDFKKEIIKSQIKNWIGENNSKIYARKCDIKQVDIKLGKKFLNDNHIQGYVNSVIRYGLYFNDELVSLMCFDQVEGRKKMSENDWNLSRFCNKLNFNIVGGASKLLNHFINDKNPKRIISYADRSWSEGDLYYKLGFTKISETIEDYKYIIDNRRVNKSRFRKSKLNTELSESLFMEQNGFNKIYDCGKIKFEMIL